MEDSIKNRFKERNARGLLVTFPFVSIGVVAFSKGERRRSSQWQDRNDICLP